jgi:ABC-2 type transport system permease protein
MGVVFWKELADHFSSRRFMILIFIIILTGLWASYATGQAIRQNTETVPAQYVFLLLLTSSGETLFSLATFLGFFGPLVGITLGFDSISGEYARGTLSRVLSQPIYRDSFINGKFFAGLTTIAVLWASILLLVIGLGITLLGFPPNAEELWRMLIFAVVGIFYLGFWLALATLFSLLFQKTVTAALASIAVWLFMTLFVVIVSQGIASIVVPDTSTPESVARRADIENIIGRIFESGCSRFWYSPTKSGGRYLTDAACAWTEFEPHLAPRHDSIRLGGGLLRNFLHLFYARGNPCVALALYCHSTHQMIT